VPENGLPRSTDRPQRGRSRLPALLTSALLLAPVVAAAPSQQDPPPPDTREAAVAAFQRHDLERAEWLSTEWLEAHPRDEEIHRLLGMVRITAGMALEGEGRPREEYLTIYRKALDSLLKAETLAEGRPQPDLHHAVGYILMSEGRYERAASRFTRAIAETPGSFVLYRLRGSCRLELGRYLEAEEDLRRAVQLDPLDWTSRLLHAQALHLVGQGQAARDGLREYLERAGAELDEQRRFEVRYELYRYSMMLNDTATAREDLEEACRLRPGNLICRTELGTLYYKLGLPEKAIPELEAVLDASEAPRALRGDALHYRGLIAKQQGENTLARRLFEEALEIAPTRSDALLNYGRTLRALGEADEAKRVLERFQQVADLEKEIKRVNDRLLLDPSEREARIELIGLLIELERWTEAQGQLEELRRRHPDAEALPGLERRLATARARARSS
jgi:tetratricopeptide (TPR) repeat protein